MPSTSKKQRNLMAAAAHNPAFAKKVGVPVSVAKKFNAADKGKKFAKGGETMDKKDLAQDKKMMKKAIGLHDKQMHGGKKTDMSTLKKGGCVKKAVGGKIFAGKESKAEEAKEKKMFGKGAAYKKAETKYEGEAMKKGGGVKKYARGGGIEIKGKTKGKMV